MILRFLFLFVKFFFLASVIGLGVIAYVINYYNSKELPDYSELKKYYPPSITRLYSADGKLIEEYAKEHRIFVPINSIPKSLVHAFIAAEDKNFYSHDGIDFVSIIRAAFNNISRVMQHKRVEGGSTITQQVVKNFLLTSERSFERKIKEAILSYRLSQVFSKDQVLELYLNQIYLGKGAYGVATASLHYFNKSVEELTINESALLASLPKAPSKYNPFVDYQRSFERKNYVIGRMYDDGYITEEEAKKAMAEPITLAHFDKVQTLDADYYAAKVREEVIDMFGEEYFYTAGLTILTCADSKMQKAATKALRFGIKKYDSKRGYRGPIKNIDITDWKKSLLAIGKPEGLLDYKLSVVLDVSDSSAKIGLADGSTTEIFIKDMAWTAINLKSVHKLLKIGDVIVVEKIADKYFLQQIPDVNGGIMVVEPSTGRVLAAEGGYDFGISKFDRTTQASRQPGSLIKPFVYLTALENGLKPNDIFLDAPVEVNQGPGLPIWRPKNFNPEFLGPRTLRFGLEKSLNTITVRVAKTIGFNKAIATIKRFGVNDKPRAFVSVVLGALETTLSRMTIAYSVFANNGYKVEPHYIELIKDRKGNIIYKRDYTEYPECKLSDDNDENATPPQIISPKSEMLVDEASNYQMISLMMGGIQRGTGQGAKHLKQTIAGKTGTTNDAKDTWFIGFTPKIVVGTYIGYDNPRSLGKRQSGATVALPVFVNFMENAYKDEPSLDFTVPSSIDLVSVDYKTGKPSSGEGSIMEAFKVKNYKPEEIAKDKEDHNETSEKDHDPFAKINDLDSSNEVY